MFCVFFRLFFFFPSLFYVKTKKIKVVNYNIELKKRPQSWTSTPDINDNVSKNVNVTVNLQIPPQRRHTTILDLNEACIIL